MTLKLTTHIVKTVLTETTFDLDLMSPINYNTHGSKGLGILGGYTWQKESWKNRITRIYLLSRIAKWFVELIYPSYWAKSSINSKNFENFERTAYLDGLRGFAAFMVYCLHHQLWAHEKGQLYVTFENAFGWNGQHYFVTLPIIRTFFTGGHFAVTVFFVISGYVLSAKPLSLIHAAEFDSLGEVVASALSRRWLRLHLPVICTTFAFITTIHLCGLSTPVIEIAPTYRAEIWKLYVEYADFAFVFRNGSGPFLSYHSHSWSIPFELRGSIAIYTSLIAFSRCTRDARLLCEAGLLAYFIWFADGWFCALFLAGMLLCDLDLLATENDLPGVFCVFRPYRKGCFYVLFAISMYLGGVPTHDENIETLRHAYGWAWLSCLKPQVMWDYKWFYLIWAATFLVASIRHIPWLRAFFETRFNQYLGRISFAFYLVHGPVLWTLGDKLYAAVGCIKSWHAANIPHWINRFPLPQSGPLGLEPGFLLVHIILLPFTLWLAEVVTKVFDDQSVGLSQWLYKLTLGNWGR
jgi:peptidoglycan/LPS O-acetylase OafA/YrhL